jgi:hypothetical protein
LFAHMLMMILTSCRMCFCQTLFLLLQVCWLLALSKALSAIICISFTMRWTPWSSHILMEFLCSHI